MKVASLHIYPVKSLKGIALTEVEVERRGFRFDRRWMVVDPSGHFITQREHPEMALIHTELHNDQLRLTADGLGSIEVPTTFEGQSEKVRVWNSIVDANFGTPVADKWLSEALGTYCRLAAMPDSSMRACGLEGDQVSFADGYPVLAISQASLDDLNAKLPQPVPMARFRPNVVVDDCPAFEEDTWRNIFIGSVKMRTPKLCSRCVMTTVDQNTGERGVEPLHTLATYRVIDQKIMFGMNCIPDNEGKIAVGDPIEAI